MTIIKSNMALGKRPVPSLMDALASGIVYDMVSPAALAAGDILVLGPLQAEVKPIDVALIAEKLDSNGTPTITLTVGILTADLSDIDPAATSAWITASTAGQAGGVTRATSSNAYASGRSSATRQLGIKVAAGPATYVGAGKRIAVVLTAAG